MLRRGPFRRIVDSIPSFLRTLSMSDGEEEPYISGSYLPTVEDVLDVRTLLIERFALPVEILDTIVDFAEYWPHTTTRMTEEVLVHGRDHAQNRRSIENKLLLRSYPLGYVPSTNNQDQGQMLRRYNESYQTLPSKPWPSDRKHPDSATDEVKKLWEAKSMPRSITPCRKIVFTIKSHDQGWGGGHGAMRGTYHGGFTWFDFGLEKLSACKESEFLSPILSSGTKLLEAHELAPYPQFRLVGDLYEYSRDQAANSPPIVCSLRTVIPPTRPVDEDDLEPGSDNPEYEFHQEINASKNVLQKNVVIDRSTKTHVITWSSTDSIANDECAEAMDLEKQGRGRATGSGEFVRNMQLGDVVTVWGKARFPGWCNSVEEVQIDVFWAI